MFVGLSERVGYCATSLTRTCSRGTLRPFTRYRRWRANTLARLAHVCQAIDNAKHGGLRSAVGDGDRARSDGVGREFH